MDRIASAWRRMASAKLKAFGITLARYELIRLARYRGGLAPSMAAQELDWDRPTVTIVARACIEAGWLKRSRPVADRRSARIELTGRGEELLDRIEATRPFAEPAFGDPFDVVSGEEREMMQRLLDRVARRAADIWGK